jgi:hypothetical protein
MNDFVPDPTRPPYGEWLFGYKNSNTQAWMQKGVAPPPPAPDWKLPPPMTVPPSVAVTPTDVTITVNEWPKQPWVDEMKAYYADANETIDIEIGIRAVGAAAGVFNGDWLPGSVVVSAAPDNLGQFPATPYLPPAQTPRGTTGHPADGDYVYTVTLINMQTQQYVDWWISPPFAYPLPAAPAAEPPAPVKRTRKRKAS